MTGESKVPTVPLSNMNIFREQAVAIAYAGIAGADAGNLVSRAVSDGQIDRSLSRFYPVVVSAGKAAGAMAEAFMEALGCGGGGTDSVSVYIGWRWEDGTFCRWSPCSQ